MPPWILAVVLVAYIAIDYHLRFLTRYPECSSRAALEIGANAAKALGAVHAHAPKFQTDGRPPRWDGNVRFSFHGWYYRGSRNETPATIIAIRRGGAKWAFTTRPGWH